MDGFRIDRFSFCSIFKGSRVEWMGKREFRQNISTSYEDFNYILSK